MKLVHWPLMGGCYIWYSEKEPGRSRSPPRPLLAVPNSTAHPLTASVPITVLLYNGPLLCGFNVPIKRLIDYNHVSSSFPIIVRRWPYTKIQQLHGASWTWMYSTKIVMCCRVRLDRRCAPRCARLCSSRCAVQAPPPRSQSILRRRWRRRLGRRTQPTRSPCRRRPSPRPWRPDRRRFEGLTACVDDTLRELTSDHQATVWW